MTDTVLDGKPEASVLFDQNLSDMINAVAFRFYATYTKCGRPNAMITQEDIASQGFFGAMTAYRSFDTSRGYDNNIVPWFRSYAYSYITNAMQTYCRKFSHALSISEKSARDDLGRISDIGIVHIDKEIHNDFDTHHAFDIPVGSGVNYAGVDIDDYFFAGFSTLERNLAWDHLIDGYSLQEVSKRHDLSKSRVGEIIRELKVRMERRAKDYVQDD